MKLRVAGACASIILMAGCSGGNPGSEVGSLRNAAAVAQSAAKGSPELSLGRTARHSVANAPNRGALVSYQNGGKPAKIEGAYTWYPIAISEEHAMQALLTGQMTVPSPDGTQTKLRYERHEEHPDGNWTWVGRVEGGDPNQEAILTFGEKAVYGSIPQPNGNPALSLETRQGALYAVKTDPSKVRNPNTADTDIMLPPALALRESVSQAAAVQQGATMQSAVMAGAPPTAANTIDVAVGYTAGFAASVGGQSAAVTRLTFLTQVGNQAFENSQVNGYLRLVRAIQVNYADNTKNSDALSELTGNNGTASVPVPASLVPLRDARNEFGADVAVLVRRFHTPENDGCGVAWLNGADQKPINPATDANYAYAVISDGSDQGTDGNNYFCAPETMVHEIGHIAGSAHDRDNSKKTNGELQYGTFAYSFGMKTDSANGNFYTVMSYGANNQTAYRAFSNPNITICGGRACGVANTTDNARSLNQTISVVSQFRSTVVPFANKIKNDINGDSKGDLIWSRPGQLAYWLMDGIRVAATFAYNVDPSYAVVGTGDFDGNGYVDIVWRHSGGLVYMWSGSNAGFTGSTVHSLGNDWRLAGTGDVNGDGKSDFLWHHPSSGQFVYWLMNGPQISTTYGLFVDAAFSIIGTGDLDGNGLVDILWQNRNGQIYSWVANGSGTYTAYYVGALSTDWKLVGTGDINGDAKADLLWSRPASSQLVYWTMNGPITLSTFALPIDSAFQAIGTGDFDGNGRVDIVWRNNAGQTYFWLGGTNGGFTSHFISALSGWNLPPE